MKKFLAIYLGSREGLERSGWLTLSDQERKVRSDQAIAVWMKWAAEHGHTIVDHGSPLGKTLRVSPEGIADIHNALTGYVIVKAESLDAAAKLFEGHPHFTMFPGDSVEIIECLPLPGAGS